MSSEFVESFEFGIDGIEFGDNAVYSINCFCRAFER